MRTISIDISHLEFQKFGLKADIVSFSAFVDIVSRELSRQNLAKTVELAERYGLSKMTMDEISKEIKAVRNNNGLIPDTNVLVSANIQRRYPYFIVDRVFADPNLELCFSSELFTEYVDVFNATS